MSYMKGYLIGRAGLRVGALSIAIEGIKESHRAAIVLFSSYKHDMKS